MPGFDQTGPRGQGAMTGGCRGYRNMYFATGLPGWMRAQRGARAFGGPQSALTREDELAALKQQSEMLKSELEAVQARLQSFESA